METHERTGSGIISRLVSAIRDHFTYSATVRDLRRMSDIQLADIGIERHRISEVAAGLLAKTAAKREYREVHHHGMHSLHGAKRLGSWPS